MRPSKAQPGNRGEGRGSCAVHPPEALMAQSGRSRISRNAEGGAASLPVRAPRSAATYEDRVTFSRVVPASSVSPCGDGLIGTGTHFVWHRTPRCQVAPKSQPRENQQGEHCRTARAPFKSLRKTPAGNATPRLIRHLPLTRGSLHPLIEYMICGTSVAHTRAVHTSAAFKCPASPPLRL